MVETTPNWIEDRYSDRARRAGHGIVGLNPRYVADIIAFGDGAPDPSSMPISDIIESTRIALERDGEWALQYAPGSGTPELIEQLTRKLERDQGIRNLRTENILITNGGSQALGLIFEAFINPGDVLLTESPFFLGAVHYCHASGADVRELPLDDEGLVIASLEEELNRLRDEGRQAKFLYVVPNFQNPTGVTYSLERRQRIIELAREHDLLILEDDAYYDLRYAGEQLPTFFELAGDGRVMYVGTFSKIIGAGMRLGWVVAAPDIIAHLSGLKTDYSTNTFANHIVAEFAGSGTLVEHIEHLKSVYRSRRDAMLAALEELMPEDTSWTVPTGGFFIWLTMPGGVDSAEVARLARERGVGVSPGRSFFVGDGGDNNLRLSYSFTDEEQIRRGIGILADIVGEQARQR